MMSCQPLLDRITLLENALRLMDLKHDLLRRTLNEAIEAEVRLAMPRNRSLRELEKSPNAENLAAYVEANVKLGISEEATRVIRGEREAHGLFMKQFQNQLYACKQFLRWSEALSYHNFDITVVDTAP